MCYYLCMDILSSQSQLYSTKQAAELLGVTRHQVAMLVRNEEISASMVSGVLLIDPHSLLLYKQLHCGRGRPLSSDVAWGMIWMLSGLDTPWLSYQQHRRSVLKLREISAKELVWQARKRSRLYEFKAPAHMFNVISSRLTLTGKSTNHPEAFGIPKNSREIEGYASEAVIDVLVDEFNLEESINGNLFIHCPSTTPWLEPGSTQRMAQMPVAAVACDLAASLVQHEAQAGIASLETLLAGFRRLSV